MKIAMILQMAASAGDRAVVTAQDRSQTATERLARAHSAESRTRKHPAVLNLGTHHPAHPIAPPGAALAGAPFRSELPKTETGTPPRRTLLAELETTHA